MKNTNENTAGLIKEAADCIREADALLVCAGAGIGVDSGLPDFRGNQGFWKAYPPFAKLGHSFIDMANPHWFESDPHLAWGFYGHRLNLYRSTVPHKGFEILLEWGKEKPGGYFVFTSNVDGQFQAAGFDDHRVNECHGSIHHFQCASSCTESIWSGEGTVVAVAEETMRAADPLPRCTNCGGMARPNILMFGDWGWISHRTQEQQYGFNDWLDHNKKNSIVIVECGAGTGVPTVRMTSESIVSRYSARLVRINVREPHVPPGQTGLPMGALEALTKIKNIL
ncbi:MAG: NAD-dependent deacetylase [bacterium]|nr:NAD-dependent deacetylase [bacterium]